MVFCDCRKWNLIIATTYKLMRDAEERRLHSYSVKYPTHTERRRRRRRRRRRDSLGQGEAGKGTGAPVWPVEAKRHLVVHSAELGARCTPIHYSLSRRTSLIPRAAAPLLPLLLSITHTLPLFTRCVSVRMSRWSRERGGGGGLQRAAHHGQHDQDTQL